MTDEERIKGALESFFEESKCPVEGRMGEYVTSNGVLVRYFQSNCSENAIIERMLSFEEYDPEIERREFEIWMRRELRLNGLHVRKELGDKLVNLGMRVNNVPSRRNK